MLILIAACALGGFFYWAVNGGPGQRAEAAGNSDGHSLQAFGIVVVLIVALLIIVCASGVRLP